MKLILKRQTSNAHHNTHVEVQVKYEETINKTKRQPSDWEKIFASEATDKRLISRIYKQLMQLNIKKNKQPNPKMGRRPK